MNNHHGHQSTVERVLMAPDGQLAVGIRLRFYDKYLATDSGVGELGEYQIRLEPSGFDAWAISQNPNELGGPWLMFSAEHFADCEDLGEL